MDIQPNVLFRLTENHFALSLFYRTPILPGCMQARFPAWRHVSHQNESI
jgi:hypothetical protein